MSYGTKILDPSAQLLRKELAKLPASAHEKVSRTK